MTDVEKQAADAAAKEVEAKKAEEIRAKIGELRLAGIKIYTADEMDEAIQRRQDALDKLRKHEDAEKKKEEEEAKKKGEFEKLLEAEKTEHDKTKIQLEAEKKEADAYRAYRKSAVEAIKKQMGDKWLPEYETFSLESLSKLSGLAIPFVGVINSGGKPPDEYANNNPFSKKTLNIAKQIEFKKTKPELAARLEAEAIN